MTSDLPFEHHHLEVGCQQHGGVAAQPARGSEPSLDLAVARPDLNRQVMGGSRLRVKQPKDLLLPAKLMLDHLLGPDGDVGEGGTVSRDNCVGRRGRRSAAATPDSRTSA